MAVRRPRHSPQVPARALPRLSLRPSDPAVPVTQETVPPPVGRLGVDRALRMPPATGPGPQRSKVTRRQEHVPQGIGNVFVLRRISRIIEIDHPVIHTRQLVPPFPQQERAPCRNSIPRVFIRAQSETGQGMARRTSAPLIRHASGGQAPGTRARAMTPACPKPRLTLHQEERLRTRLRTAGRTRGSLPAEPGAHPAIQLKQGQRRPRTQSDLAPYFLAPPALPRHEVAGQQVPAHRITGDHQQTREVDIVQCRGLLDQVLQIFQIVRTPIVVTAPPAFEHLVRQPGASVRIRLTRLGVPCVSTAHASARHGGPHGPAPT